MSKFSLIQVYERNGDTVAGVWLQNHTGTIESAQAKARATEAANSNRITVAVTEQTNSATPNYTLKEYKEVTP